MIKMIGLRYFSFLLVGLLCLTSWSCGKQEEDTGPPIPVEELTVIITEALLLEPAGRELSPVYQDTAFQRIYGLILTPRGYDIPTFTESMMWLQEDPKRLQVVYKEVLENLQELDKKVN